MVLAQALLTDERLTRLLDAAELVLSDEDRLALAGLGLDSLSDAVSDASILHFVANLDASLDVQLLLQTGEQVLAWLVGGDPAARAQELGALLDALTDPDRLERSVRRNDEVRWDCRSQQVVATAWQQGRQH